MDNNNLPWLMFIPLLISCFYICRADAASEPDPVERGKYLVTVSGCNDCHTEGFLLNEGKTPQSEWLKGSAFGWRGPWGTTYPPNLRLFVQDKTEEQWLQEARTLKRRPPMPWFDLNIMQEDDLRAIYRFIKSLGEPGKPAPAYLPPEQEPPMPYALFPPPQS